MGNSLKKKNRRSDAEDQEHVHPPARETPVQELIIAELRAVNERLTRLEDELMHLNVAVVHTICGNAPEVWDHGQHQETNMDIYPENITDHVSITDDPLNHLTDHSTARDSHTSDTRGLTLAEIGDKIRILARPDRLYQTET